ncbi:unnamed protein product [Oikopleura dioica]|uniref:Peptidase S1 domain-containing protein n=1 Tax=Oikopleura dioica TaxID=34765 RepID=E4X619_OIKDI|nr:unnamed protein product [Oikopleura dioica]
MLKSAVIAMASAAAPGIKTVDTTSPFCIGCELAVNGQIPWQASLQTSGHFCGGSILSSTFVNTAAHCKQSSNFTVQVGNVDNRSGQRITTAQFIAHPRYNGSLIINDFGVIRLSSPITFNDFAQPIALIAPSAERLPDRTPLMTSGFGYYQYQSNGVLPDRQTSRYLRWLDTEYVSVARCKSFWSGQTIDNSVQCADVGGSSICSGDSGGPLVYKVNGEYQLIGATSWAHVYCNSNGYPQGWSNLWYPEFNQWTRDQAGL